MATINFPNGNVYYGEINDAGQPHGRGHMDYKLNGYFAEYDGMWENGVRSGKGRYYKQSTGGGASCVYKYEGDWQGDLQHGEGVEKYSREQGVHLATVREIYTGGFREGKRHGHGVIEKDNYEGSFTNGVNRFEGTFDDGKTVGHGVWEYANGDRFEGEFADYGNKHGHGVYTYKNGLRFEGEWELNSFVMESLIADPALETPMLIVTEHHSGFDYDRTGSFIFAARKGLVRYAEAASLGNSLDLGGDRGLEIISVDRDSVTFAVSGVFMKGGKPAEATVQRGETALFESVREATARIYDEEYDYTIEDRLEVICR